MRRELVSAEVQKLKGLSRSIAAPTGVRELLQHGSLCPVPCPPILSAVFSTKLWDLSNGTHHLPELGVAGSTRTARLALFWVPAILCEVLEAVTHVGADR